MYRQKLLYVPTEAVVSLLTTQTTHGLVSVSYIVFSIRLRLPLSPVWHHPVS